MTKGLSSRQVSRRYFDAWNSGDISLVDDVFAPDFLIHDAASPMLLSMGPAGVKERIRAYRAAMPDLHISIEDVIAENDRVVTRWVLRGGHSGRFEGVDGEGASVEVSGTTIHRIRNSQIVEQWVNWDTDALRRQMSLERK
ncbi:hypothetical protein LCGC14_1492300 [marine sediment metagenome]|uniref:SnoaL-like domain-containing protein n=1 Tax=marine sediment metagenome TaxID=412755 RepID=A0A0F9J6F4_9ZZZZ